MCGRFTLKTRMRAVADAFDFQPSPDVRPRYNIAPTQEVAAVRLDNAGQRQFAFLRWGLIPSWAKDTKIASSTINARGETVAEKPAFRAAFKRRRCLVLADGYYEWAKGTKPKQPYLYELEVERPFAFAGLWEFWKGPDGATPIESCTLITTEANALAAEVHDRMPVILPEAEHSLWLDPEFQDREKLVAMLQPFPADEMKVRPVSTYVSNARNEGPECIEPARDD